ncbi:MAG: SET domain-containing protein [Flavisolibacter sp.]|nr:SET domain-containing protein [Flavisolibacter sp.]
MHFKIIHAKSRIHGKGSFAKENIPARKRIGILGGQIISKFKARKMAVTKSIAVVELWNGWAIDASDEKGLRYVNHSCDPNTFMRNINYLVEFYALKDIAPGEELTCDYGTTHHDGKLACTCGAVNCKGSL